MRALRRTTGSASVSPELRNFFQCNRGCELRKLERPNERPVLQGQRNPEMGKETDMTVVYIIGTVTGMKSQALLFFNNHVKLLVRATKCYGMKSTCPESRQPLSGLC